MSLASSFLRLIVLLRNVSFGGQDLQNLRTFVLGVQKTEWKNEPRKLYSETCNSLVFCTKQLCGRSRLLRVWNGQRIQLLSKWWLLTNGQKLKNFHTMLVPSRMKILLTLHTPSSFFGWKFPSSVIGKCFPADGQKDQPTYPHWIFSLGNTCVIKCIGFMCLTHIKINEE